jgi:5'-methylthioadenosine phosphorylase
MRQRLWPPTVDVRVAEIAVIGGSGFYALADDLEERSVDTPYGSPSDTITLATFGGQRVAFLPRHGRDHTVPAHAVNFRANLWALHSLGVRGVIAPCTVGSLRADVHPGEMMVLDNLVDRTWGRADTYFDGSDGVVNHTGFAEPYDERLRATAVAACRANDVTVHDSGTVVVINGPRFSTRAESRWFASIGASVVNMTQYPESFLAAELALPYCGIALVTDYDAGIEGVHERAVTMDEVLAVMRANVDRVRGVIHSMIELLGADDRPPTSSSAHGGS